MIALRPLVAIAVSWIALAPSVNADLHPAMSNTTVAPDTQVDAPAGAVDLREHCVTVGRDVGVGEAQVRHPGDVLWSRIGEVAAAQLTSAFEQMPHDGAAREPVDIIGRPRSQRSTPLPWTTTSSMTG